MKKMFKKWTFGLIVVVLLAIPFIINYLYMEGSEITTPNTAFSASDMILFYGSILSFIGTVSLGYVAYGQNERANKLVLDLHEKNTKLNVRPFVAINNIEGEGIENIIQKITKKIEAQPQIDFNKRYLNNLQKDGAQESEMCGFLINEEKISFVNDLYVQEEIAKYRDKTANEIKSSLVYLGFDAISLSVHVAVSFSVRLYKSDSYLDNKFDVRSLSTTLKQNISYQFAVLINEPERCIGVYVMELSYYDILGNNYTQNHKLIVRENIILLETEKVKEGKK